MLIEIGLQSKKTNAADAKSRAADLQRWLRSNAIIFAIFTPSFLGNKNEYRRLGKF